MSDFSTSVKKYTTVAIQAGDPQELVRGISFSFSYYFLFPFPENSHFRSLSPASLPPSHPPANTTFIWFPPSPFSPSLPLAASPWEMSGLAQLDNSCQQAGTQFCSQKPARTSGGGDLTFSCMTSPCYFPFLSS